MSKKPNTDLISFISCCVELTSNVENCGLVRFTRLSYVRYYALIKGVGFPGDR